MNANLLKNFKILKKGVALFWFCVYNNNTMKYRGVEQLVARRAHNPKVVGSSPASATMLNVHNGTDRYEHSFLCTSVFSMYRSRVTCSFFVMLLSPLVYTKLQLLALYPWLKAV